VSFCSGRGDIATLIQKATEQLRSAGCDAPRLDAELLLGHVLGLSRAQLVSRWRQSPSPEQVRAFFMLVQRRAQREPLAYILGYKEFFGLEIEVDRNVLIPRPETELLVERAIEAARQIDPAGKVIIADIGTGSGAIAVSLAVSLPEAEIFAVDQSTSALAVAARNCARHGVSGRVRSLQGDLLSAVPGPVEMVVANLPYVAHAELETLGPEIRLYEPSQALDGGPDGLALIRRLLMQVAGAGYRPQAMLLEIGSTQGRAVVELVTEILGRADVSLIQDYAGLDRIVVVRR